ncbi:MAG: TetR/AcrR family transcriptional regulator [Acidimicrobiales bacterium]
MADPTTRQRVVAAASDAFARSGLDTVTLDDIAQDAGVHLVTLHRNFPGGRDEVVMAAVLHQALELKGAIADVIERATDCEAALVDSVTLTYRTFRDNRALAAILTDTSVRSAILGETGGDVHAVAAELWERIRARAVREGRVVTGASDEQVVDHVLRVGMSLIVEPGVVRNARDVRTYVRRFVVPALIVG